MGRYTVEVDGRLHLDRLRIVQCPWFAVLLTRIHTPDPGRDPHDHSRPFTSLILRGGYVEQVWPHPQFIPAAAESGISLPPGVTCRRRRWSVHYMPVRHAHTIDQVEPGTLTLLLAGRHRGTWHFWTPEGPVDWKTYGSEEDQ